MGRYKNGINGPISGKVGHVIGANWRGVEVLKSLSGPSTKAPSEKQLDQRFIFAMVNNWLKPLRDLIWIGFQVFTGTKTPMNGAVSLLLKEAITGNNRENYAIDFAKVILSRGELLISLIKQVLVLIDHVLRIEWQSPSGSVFCKPDDKANIVVYNESKQKFVIFGDVAKRADERVDLQLPRNFAGDRVYAWMHYVNVKGDAVSTSVYVGEYTFTSTTGGTFVDNT